MFDFLFKRATKPVVSPTTPVVQSAAVVPQVARDAARAQAEKIAHDETASVDFLLLCEFADARLIAAQSIHSKEALQRVAKAMRNSDRRVARLMQSRLDALQARHQVDELAKECVRDATSMSTQPYLTAQKAGELDRRWTTLAAPSTALQDTFNAARSVIAERLIQQAELQRKLIDTQACLRRLVDRTLQIAADELHTELARHEADIEQFGASIELVNVPKNLLDQCKSAVMIARETLALQRQREQQSATLVALLSQWEAMPAASLDPAALQREWQRASGVIDVLPEVKARWSTLLASVAANRPAKIVTTTASFDAAAAAPVEDHSPTFIAALQALEQALAQGSLQQAQDADRRLRALSSAAAITAAQTARLSRLRAQLGQLQSWARWGGTISREELQKAALALPQQTLTVVELAKKIGNLRQQWKSLDATSGPAFKEAWQLFDAACTTAYAPVAEHHRVLDEMRRTNSETAQRQIAAIDEAADQLLLQVPIDWKIIGQLCQRSQQEWQRIGPTERRDKQALDRRFQMALQRLLQPLGIAQKAEQALREQLITSAQQLGAREPGTLDVIRHLQQQWQTRANAVPLERRAEQALWLRFRAACDAVFAQRKESAVADDQQRHENLRLREALCVALETAGGETIEPLAALLRDSSAAWSACGAVPRTAQDTIDKRYRQAVGVVKTTIETLQRNQAAAQRQAVQQKLQLCLRLESALTDLSESAANTIASLESMWQGLLAVPTRFDAILIKRFELALEAKRASDIDYVNHLKANQSVLQNDLLRFEIVLSLDSPPQLARERLQLQVAVLQSALRDGQTATADENALKALCALAAAIDTETSARLERVVAQLLG